MAIVPPEVMAQATAEDREMFARIEKIVTNIRRDEQEGIIFPSLRDDQGNLLYELKLLSSGGSRQFDTDKIISRYDSRMAMCALVAAADGSIDPSERQRVATTRSLMLRDAAR